MSKIFPNSPPLPADPVRIEGFRLDWGRLRLVDANGEPSKLTPKAGAVLAQLLGARGRTVSRAELFDAVWPGSASSDEVLTQVVQELRRAFGDRKREPAWIVTVPKLGYRWEGPEAVVDMAPSADGPGVARRDDSTPADGRIPVRNNTLRMAAAWLALLALAALAAGGYVLRRHESRATALPRALPLAREPAREFDPHLGGVGRQLVYVRDDGTRHEIVLRTVPEGPERTLVSATDATLGAPRFSRSGDRIAYLRRTPARCEVRVLSLHDEADDVIATDCPTSLATSIDWSADDAWLYYPRIANGDAVAQRNVAIHRLRLADKNLERISDAGRWLSTDNHPRLHGDTLAFVRDGDGRNRIVTMPAAGGAESELPYALWPYRIEWDGDDFLLAMHGSSGLELWRGTRDGALGAMLAREGAGPGVSVGTNGGIVFERHRADDNLWRIDLAAPASSPRQLTQDTGSEHSPRLSPDGRSLAYLSDASGDVEVHVLDLATQATRRWSNVSPRVPLDLRWSPQGDRAVLIVGTEQGKRVRILDADGSLAMLPPALRDLVPGQVEWDPSSGDVWLLAEHDGRRELVRARAPDFARIEQVVDGSVAAFALDGGTPWLLRPASRVFESLDGTRTLAPPAVAVPDNQWTVRGRWLAQSRQIGGPPSRLTLQDTASGDLVRTLGIPLPEPPLGRPMDLGETTLFYGRRDRVESDLYRLDPAPRR